MLKGAVDDREGAGEGDLDGEEIATGVSNLLRVTSLPAMLMLLQMKPGDTGSGSDLRQITSAWRCGEISK